MPTVTLAPALARWLSPEGQSRGEVRVTVAGDTVGNLLNEVFVQYPILLGYVVDERGVFRHPSWRSSTTSQSATNEQPLQLVPPDGEVYIFQALSGG